MCQATIPANEQDGYDFHHFNGYTVSNRVNMSNMSPLSSTVDTSNLLPSKEDMLNLDTDPRVTVRSNVNQF